MASLRNIQIITAPSILGLRSNGVEKLGDSLLAHGLKEKLHTDMPVCEMPSCNASRTNKRSHGNGLLNEEKLEEFSRLMFGQTLKTLAENKFPLVLGGDCSIIIGIMAALKSRGTYGLIFIDAHADFYLPEQSTSGEAADSDLALVTGRGPASLTNLYNLQPYVKDEHAFQVGQRDEAEAEKFGSQRIQDTSIHCFNYALFKEPDLSKIADTIIAEANSLSLDGYWMHFDTDVLSDDANPAVDYRLPEGLTIEQATYLLHHFLAEINITGCTVTIFNPLLDTEKTIAPRLTDCIVRAFQTDNPEWSSSS